jgi:AcrR family transcriptional regulator
MSRGQLTKQAILEHAASLASRVGLQGVTIGGLADDMKLSKSGLFAHFRSKEALEVSLLEHAAARFVEHVIKPALTAPRGEARVREVFRRWMEWPEASRMAGGCFFVAAATELDDRPGPARDVLVRQQKDWLELIANVTRTAIAEKHFQRRVDPDQFAFELYGIALSYHYAKRLLSDPRAAERAHVAFEALIDRAKTP